MDKQDIRRHLTEITQEEITDVNLLPEIRKQLEISKPRARQPLFKLARVTIVVLLLLTISAVGYAIYQNNISSPTIPQDLITEFSLEQTIDNMTLNLEWAYADANRVTVAVSSVYDTAITSSGHFIGRTLASSDGTVIPPAFDGGGGGGGGGSTIVENFSIASYDMSAIQNTASTIDLILTIEYGPELPLDDVSDSSGGCISCGGGGSGGGSENDATEVVVVPVEEAPERTFRFEFSLPVYPARTGDISSDTQDNAISIHINNVQVTPSMTQFQLCSPLLAEEWIPRVLLNTNEALPDYIDDALSLVSISGENVYYGQLRGELDEQSCSDVAIPAPFIAERGELSLEIGMFRYREESTEADVLEDVQYFAEQGFTLSYEIIESPAVNTPQNVIVNFLNSTELALVTIEEYPATMTLSQARMYLGLNAMVERYDGKWAFTITVDD